MKISELIQSCIHFWLNVTGQKVDFSQQPYLMGPVGESKNIGEEFYQRLAEKENLQIKQTFEGGLLPDFHEALDQTSPFLDQLDPEIATFYEQTSQYNLEVWSKWVPPFSLFAKLLIRVVSVEMKQLNIPLDSLETSYGMSSAIIQLLNNFEKPKYTCWLRKSNKSNQVVYAGFYDAFKLYDLPYKHIRVVFPLPQGNVTVLLKIEIMEDGSVQLISDGKRFKGTGYFRMHKNSNGIFKWKKIPINETIHVFRDQNNVLRTDHYFRWWNITFLQLHYKIIPK